MNFVPPSLIIVVVLVCSSPALTTESAKQAHGDFVLGCAIGLGRDDANDEVMRASLLQRIHQCHAIRRRLEENDTSPPPQSSRQQTAVFGCVTAQKRLYVLNHYQLPPDDIVESLQSWCNARLWNYDKHPQEAREAP
jgi:hypothetical protein